MRFRVHLNDTNLYHYLGILLSMLPLEVGMTGKRTHKCLDCEKWVTRGAIRCRECSSKRVAPTRSICQRGDKSLAWRGGRIKDSRGYIHVKLSPGDFFYSMASSCQHYVLEHRLVMAKQLGRCLHRWEMVHHRNHVKDDNNVSNLQLVSDDRHGQITILENEIARLKVRLARYE